MHCMLGVAGECAERIACSRTWILYDSTGLSLRCNDKSIALTKNSQLMAILHIHFIIKCYVWPTILWNGDMDNWKITVVQTRCLSDVDI